MTLRRGRAFPIILTILLIIIIIYLFANIKQPYVVCTKETTNDLGIEINENIQVTLDGNKIQKMDLTKTLIFPEQYLKQEDNYLNSMHYIIENSYEYLPSDTVTMKQESDRIIANIVVDQDETVIVNNIEFENIDDLQIKINSNTKAQDVVTLSINDNYTEGEFMTHMKNNGYTCN